MPKSAAIARLTSAARTAGEKAGFAALVIAIVVAPSAIASALVAADVVWELVVAASNAVTATLYATPVVRDSPGQTADALRFLFGAILAAAAPSVSIGAFERAWGAKALAALLFYPLWLMVILAPAMVVRQFASEIDAARLGSHVSIDFLVTFSACAASIALCFSLWARTRPLGLARSRRAVVRV
ncbi:hypothetical protein [Chenggangzhangella methanolivorans]|uniref:Uncharacterized protein n=1 Tax=Chenggangzhangella methanolivorans TaxID=1437009 RepID=A0A9E6UNF7_9HYPH|nr:hypothetical protein [Chenggangzhangella methanolivorans]QZO00139.1 hypothetical protein K6K41_26960 [Chenggangzhangella methanolivorans]